MVFAVISHSIVGDCKTDFEGLRGLRIFTAGDEVSVSAMALTRKQEYH